MKLRIATRESPLALWQAEHVRDLLHAAHPQLDIELVPMTTSGDQLQTDTLAASGGKGLFVKELEVALLDGRADIAVHSMKDVPVRQPEGLSVSVFLAPEDPRDAFVSNSIDAFDDLPEGARVGTASLRRQSLVKLHRPDLEVGVLRGNVGTRLGRLDAGQFDAIILACAGLRRLGLSQRVRQALPVELFVPAIGQGIVGIEHRSEDDFSRSLLRALHFEPSAIRLSAERAFNARLGGACTVPVAGHATIEGGRLSLDGMVGAPDGSRNVRQQLSGPVEQAASIGMQLAERLIEEGADVILGELGIKV